MRVDDYEIEEVAFADNPDGSGVAWQVTVRGYGLVSVAQPLTIRVGEQPTRFLRIASDERSASGYLLQPPDTGAIVEVRLGAEQVARHPEPVDPSSIRRR